MSNRTKKIFRESNTKHDSNKRFRNKYNQDELSIQTNRLPYKNIGLLIAVFVLGAILRLQNLIFSTPSQICLGSLEHPDHLGNQWLFWGLWENIKISKNLWTFHNDLYYYPIGDSPWLAGNGMDSIFALPLQILFGWPMGVHIYVFFVLVAVGFSGFYLGQKLNLSFWTCIFLGTSIQSSTYLLHHANAGRFSQFNVVFLILGLALFLDMYHSHNRQKDIQKDRYKENDNFQPNSKGSGWKLPVALLFCGLGYWYYLWFFGLLAFLYMLFYCRDRNILQKTLISAARSLFLCVPFLGIFLYNWSDIPGSKEVFPNTHAIQDSLQMAFPLLIYSHDPQKLLFGEGLSVFLFIGVLFLYLKKDASNWKFILCWTTIALVGLILSFGVHTPFYEFLYGQISVLQRFWWPSRHILLYKIALYILAAKGFDIWIKQQKDWSIRIASISTPVCLILQGFGNYAIWASTFQTIAAYDNNQLPFAKDVVIIQPPLSPKVSKSQLPLLFQIFHQRRLITGHAQWVDRVRPREWDIYMREHDFFRQLLDYEEGNGSGRILYNQNMHLKMIGDKTVILVVDPILFPISHQSVKNAYREMAFQFFDQPVLQDQNILMWDIRKWNGRESIELPYFSWPVSVNPGNGNFPISSELPQNNIIR